MSAVRLTSGIERATLMSVNWTDPTRENVLSACATFDGWMDNPDPALSLLFEHFPHNTSIDHVLLKVTALNATYSTLIRAYSEKKPTIYDLARHIVSLNIDERLRAGDVALVERIAFLDLGDGRKARNYSFATKYCNWHQHYLYPIYDSRVDVYLWELNKRTPFCVFQRQDLYWNYPKFVEIVEAFRMRFGLQEFNFKQIDKFLYVSGGKLLKVAPGENIPNDLEELEGEPQSE